MILTGAIINALAIFVGGLLGLVFKFIPENIKDAIMKVQGLLIIAIAVQMVFQANDLILTFISLIIGVVIGEVVRLELMLNQFGHWLELKLGDKHGGNVSQGFISGALVFIVGAMGIVGGLDAGLRGNHEVLITKSIMDFFIALVMSTTYGIGVLLAGIPTFFYESGIILSAQQIARFVPESTLNEMIEQVTATGGVILFAIGLNMLSVTHMRVGNMIPAIFTAILLVYIISFF